ncbi:efflux RND transporter periplasmic adaptor subunit [Sinisalibacter aestuarii]|uniref:efflux RND transporter periplasmic adaptor subunit n=1 Tax=Sinisalibacter aestuarii TaxID=2949426 RepID=UPI00248FD817|nr:efflux RND transporter periplasmic adaptor subunit [Sinisalibacter aestuarii]
MVVLVLALAAGGWWYLQGGGQDASASVSYRTDTVTREDLEVTITATGTIEPLNLVEISSELSGTLIEVLVDFNDTVNEGEVLARLDTTEIDAQLAVLNASHAAAEAQLASAQATLDEARESHATSQSLFDRGVVTQSTLDSNRATLARAEAAYHVAEANVALAEANFEAEIARRDKTEITSPITGVVLDVAAEPGQIVAASLSAPTLFTIAEDLSQMELQADIAEADIGQVSAGDNATFTVEAYDTAVFTAQVTQVRFASEESDGLVIYKAILSVENPDLRLRPGMTAVADIVVAEATDALTVPNAALRYVHPQPAAPEANAQSENDGGGGLIGMLMPRRPGSNSTGARADGKSLWVMRDGVPVQLAVETGATDGSRTVVVSDMLAEGDLVITARLLSD